MHNDNKASPFTLTHPVATETTLCWHSWLAVEYQGLWKMDFTVKPQPWPADVTVQQRFIGTWRYVVATGWFTLAPWQPSLTRPSFLGLYFTPLTQSSLSLDAVAAVTRSKEKQASPVNGSVAIRGNVQHWVMEHASLAQAKCFGSSQRCQNICVIITTIIFHQFEPKHLNDNDLNHFHATMKVFLFRMKCV